MDLSKDTLEAARKGLISRRIELAQEINDLATMITAIEEALDIGVVPPLPTTKRARRPVAVKAPAKKRRMSADARKRIAAAQKARGKEYHQRKETEVA